jgi:hypothetical protein
MAIVFSVPVLFVKNYSNYKLVGTQAQKRLRPYFHTATLNRTQLFKTPEVIPSGFSLPRFAVSFLPPASMAGLDPAISGGMKGALLPYVIPGAADAAASAAGRETM